MRQVSLPDSKPHARYIQQQVAKETKEFNTRLLQEYGTSASCESDRSERHAVLYGTLKQNLKKKKSRNVYTINFFFSPILLLLIVID
jgi:hypothetical protein